MSKLSRLTCGQGTGFSPWSFGMIAFFIIMKYLSTEKTMTSREIAELTGKQHGHVIRDIQKLNNVYEKMGGVSKVGETTYINPQNNVKYKQFNLTKRQSYDLLTGYSVELRIRVVARWQEMEKKNESLLPDFTNPADAARAWADQYEGRKAAELESAAMKPKAEFYDRVTESDDVLEMSEVAKILSKAGKKIGRNNLFAFLRENDILRINNQPYQEYVDLGYFGLIEQEYTVKGKTGINTKTVVYQKGLDYIRRKLDKGYRYI